MNYKVRYILLLLIGLLSLLMHYKNFPKDLMSVHVWRQTQTQSNIINFYEEDMNILNPRRNNRGNTDGILRLEFPLMQWLVACSYKIFGNHLIVCRIFMFITGLFSILGIYRLLNALFNIDLLALIGAWAFGFSPTFYYYMINPMPDNFALCCSIWGMAFFFLWYRKNKLKFLWLSGIFLSTGALCKLPFILYFAVPFLYFLMQILKFGMNKKLILRVTVIFSFVLPPLIWYITVIPGWNGNIIIKGMLVNRDSFATIFVYLRDNLLHTFPELLLNYGSLVFFLAGFYFLLRKRTYKDSKFPLILIWSLVILAYYLYEVNAITTHHDYYFFPFFPLIFILVAYGAYHLLSLKIKVVRYLTFLLILLLPVICYFRMKSRWNPESPGFNKDLLTYKNDLQNASPDDSLVVAGNDISENIFFYYIHKKGWSFCYDELTSQSLQSMIEKGAKYLYTDSKNIYGNTEILKLCDQLILEKGSIRVYHLKIPH